MIVLNASCIALGGVPVLHDITFQAQAGEMVALCGPNGAGKTTLLRALAGLLPGLPVPDPRQIAYLPQGARSAWGLTVGEVVALGRLPHGDANCEAVARAMRLCGVTDLLDSRIDRISGGQARRAMLARVIATEAKVLLLDEPTEGIQPNIIQEIGAVLRKLVTERGMTVVLVEQYLDFVKEFGSRFYIMNRGQVVAQGACNELSDAHVSEHLSV